MQLEEFAKSVNHGENKLAELHNAVNDAEMRLQARQLPGFPGTSNPFPEAILSQGRRLAKYYEAMLLARKLPVTKDTMDALRYFALLEELEPRRIAEWNEARARFAADKSLPDTKAVFGREILPAGQ